MTNDERIFERLGGIDQKLEMVYQQTLKTNGRVTKLEQRLDGVDVKMATADGTRKGIKISKDFIIALLSIAIAIIGLYIRFK